MRGAALEEELPVAPAEAQELRRRGVRGAAWRSLLLLTIIAAPIAVLAGCENPIDKAAAARSATPTAAATFVPVPGMPDLTQTDVTKIADFKGRRASIFGVRIGMTEDEVRAAIDAAKLVSKKELRHSYGVSTQLGVYDEVERPLMNVLWRPGATGVDEIVVFAAAKPRIVGDAQKLFTEEALDAASGLRKDFLGDAPAIPKREQFLGIEIERHRFSARDIEIIVLEDAGKRTVQFSLRRL
jgi:hypothetical protein